ncbi:MAG: hypothetical protein DMG97_21370 [Acidobacteria bacterium]|nr:MAG: hypothetical protein DMG97_21370 [Acidobacteriota bacterium]
MMKAHLKSFVANTAYSPIAWPVYKCCGMLSGKLAKIYGHALFTRKNSERDMLLAKVIEDLFPDLTVANGPFKGMRYAAAQSVGSALLPKLLGSYESELHGTLEEMFVRKYTTVVDIGCAEGYYAVGLALNHPQAEVYAFDTDPNARQACSEMASLNGVASRVHIGGFCDEKVLSSIPLGNRAMIIADCEGYEGALFTEELVGRLGMHDLIIETHDFLDIEISTRLRSSFAGSHIVESVKTVDDISRAHTYKGEELRKYTTEEKRFILSERRPAIMEWLLMRPLGAAEEKMTPCAEASPWQRQDSLIPYACPAP